MSRPFRLFPVTIYLLAFAPSAIAAPIGPPVFTVNGGVLEGVSCGLNHGNEYLCTSPDVVAPDQSWTLSGLRSYYASDDNVDLLWLLFALRNDSSTTQTFTVSAVLPLGPLFPWLYWQSNTFVGGVLKDLTGDTASFTDAGAPIFTAAVGGATIETLLDAPQEITAGAFGSTPLGEGGLPWAFIPQPAASMGFDLRFTLSPGDLVLFEYDPASTHGPGAYLVFVGSPEPGTLLLFGFGLTGIATARRKRTVFHARAREV